MNKRKTAINAMVKFTGLWNFYFIILLIVAINSFGNYNKYISWEDQAEDNIHKHPGHRYYD